MIIYATIYCVKQGKTLDKNWQLDCHKCPHSEELDLTYVNCNFNKEIYTGC